jgi:diaminopimelate decarboxylase
MLVPDPAPHFGKQMNAQTHGHCKTSGANKREDVNVHSPRHKEFQICAEPGRSSAGEHAVKLIPILALQRRVTAPRELLELRAQFPVAGKDAMWRSTRPAQLDSDRIGK